MNIAKLMFHKWEEEPITGIAKGYKGTFAIFFYGCTMRCVYCQNSKISRAKISEIDGAREARPYHKRELCERPSIYEASPYGSRELCDEMIKAEINNAASISFITGALYIDEIVETIKLAKKKGLRIPVVYNSSAYETVSQIKKLEGLIDIYLPDLKYYNDELGKKYSGVPNYEKVAKKCIEEMYRQVKNKMIVRHLVLPSNTENSKEVIKYLYETYGDDIWISIMSQYTPMLQNEGMENFPELKRKITKREYEKVVDYAISLGIKNAYIQDLDAADKSYIPDF